MLDLNLWILPFAVALAGASFILGFKHGYKKSTKRFAALLIHRCFDIVLQFLNQTDETFKFSRNELIEDLEKT